MVVVVVVVVSLMNDEVFSLGEVSDFSFCFTIWWIGGHVYWVLVFIFYLFLESVGLLYHLLFFSLDWVCFTNYHLLFRIDVGLFFLGWACSVTLSFFFFFLDFSSKNLLGFFFCLKVEQINFYFILFEGVPYFFLKGKQIKNFKLLYMIFFLIFKVRVVLGPPWTERGIIAVHDIYIYIYFVLYGDDSTPSDCLSLNVE